MMASHELPCFDQVDCSTRLGFVCGRFPHLHPMLITGRQIYSIARCKNSSVATPKCQNVGFMSETLIEAYSRSRCLCHLRSNMIVEHLIPSAMKVLFLLSRTSVPFLVISLKSRLIQRRNPGEFIVVASLTYHCSWTLNTFPVLTKKLYLHLPNDGLHANNVIIDQNMVWKNQIFTQCRSHLDRKQGDSSPCHTCNRQHVPF